MKSFDLMTYFKKVWKQQGVKVQVGLIKCSTSVLRAPPGRTHFKCFVAQLAGTAAASPPPFNSAPPPTCFFQGGRVSADQFTIL